MESASSINKYFIGIDLGTQSMKILISDENGNIVSKDKIKISSTFYCNESGQNIHEQDPKLWKDSFFHLLELNKEYLKSAFTICCDGTSGTVIPLDKEGNVLNSVIMYNDKRSEVEAEYINSLDCVKSHCNEMGYKFSSSFALPKIYWIKKNQPDLYEKTFKFFSPTDLLNYWLTNDIDLKTDVSNALKTGINLEELEWPSLISDELKIDINKLPKVIYSGKLIGKVSDEFKTRFSINNDISVISGATDGTAALIASGAVSPGDAFFVIGTTLVSKLISKNILIDREYGRIYCHRHPLGFWLPGGASNIGTDWIKCNFDDINLVEMDKKALINTPTKYIIYPLEGKGDRFPILNKSMRKFVKKIDENDKIVDITEYNKIPEEMFYTAHLEGVAYAIRYIIEFYEKLSGEKVAENIIISGGGSNSAPWMQIIANITGKTILIPKENETAYAGILLGINYWDKNHNLEEISKNLIKYSTKIIPNLINNDRYNHNYTIFTKILEEKMN